MNANLAIAEIILFHKLKETEKAFSYILTADRVIEIVMERDEVLYSFLNFDMLIAYYNYYMLIDMPEKAANYAETTQLLMNFHRHSYCYWRASVALLRYGEFSSIDIYGICNIIRNSLGPDDFYDLVHANVHYVLGLEALSGNDLMIADEYFSSCYQTRSIALGKDHILTAEVHFYMGYVLTRMANGPGDELRVSGEQMMLDCLKVMEAKKPFTLRSFATLSAMYADSQYPHRNYHEAVKHYTEAIDVEVQRISNTAHYTVLDFRLRLGKAHYWFKNWEAANVEFMHLYENRKSKSFKIQQKAFGEMLFSSGYCFFKMGDYPKAQEMFSLSEEKRTGSQETDFEALDRLVRFAEYQYICLKQVKVATDLLQEALKCVKRIKVDKSVMPRMMHAYFLIGFLQENLERNTESARKYYLQSLQFGKDFEKAPDPHYCDGMLALARIDLENEKIKESELKLKKGLNRALQTHALKNVDLKPFFKFFVTSRNFDENDSIEEELLQFSNVKELLRGIPGISNSEFFVAFSFDFASRLYHHNPDEGRKPRCIDLLRQCFLDFEGILGSKNKKTAECEKLLGLCYLKLGELETAELHLRSSALVL